MTVQDSTIIAEKSRVPAAGPLCSGTRTTGEQTLSYERAVPRQLVHRDAISEVFVTDSMATGDSSFETAVQLPRGHGLNENGRVHDFLLLVEVFRQSGVLMAHRHLDVPVGMPFIFTFLHLDVLDPSKLVIGPRATNGRIALSACAERNRAGKLRGFTFADTVLTVDNGPAAANGPAVAYAGGLTVASQSGYSALRSRRRAAKLANGQPLATRLLPAAPATVGRTAARNVVISEPASWAAGRAEASLVVDVDHPHLFDHQLDHVPGNLQLEACRQLAVATAARWHGLDPAGLLVVSAQIDFPDFAELDLVTRINAEVGEPCYDAARRMTVVPATVVLRQAGGTVARARLDVGLVG